MIKTPLKTFSWRFASVIILCIGVLIGLAMFLLRASSLTRRSDDGSTITIPASGDFAVRALRSDDAFLRLTDGRSQTMSYLGSARMARAVQGNEIEPVALAAGDFNRDGFTDLISAYRGREGGFLTLQYADSRALAPTTPKVLYGLRQQSFPATFLEQAAVLELPQAPDFVETGDFNRDTYLDVLVAARGSNEMFLLTGDGQRLSAPHCVTLPGLLTALATGDIDRVDQLSDVVVSTSTSSGSSLLIFQGDQSLFETAPTIHALPAAATTLAVGRLDDDNFGDVAIVADDRISILHGWAEPLATELLPPAREAGELESVSLPFSAKTIALGEFIWDRDSRTEIAVVSADGAVHIVARGELDTRPLDPAEILKSRRMMAEVRSGRRSMSDVLALEQRIVGSAQRWNAREEISDVVRVAATDAAPPLLLNTRMSARRADDLLVMHHASRQISIVNRAHPTNHSKVPGPSVLQSSLTLEAEQEPVAALPMKLNVDGRPGLVILSKGSIAPVMMMAVATTITVTVATDTNNACATTGTGTCSLRDAVRFSNTNAGADTIQFAAGLNGTPIVLAIPGSDNAAALGDLDINDSVTINGNGAANTIIDTNYTNGCGDCKVFGVNQDGTHSGIAVSFNSLTIQDGFNDHVATGTFQETGGGIDFFLTGLGHAYSMTNCVVTSNEVKNNTQSYGGGINIDSGAPNGGSNHGTVTLTGTTISNNIADSTGGGINNYEDKHNLTISGCTITGNTTLGPGGLGAQGGGIKLRSTNGGTVTIQSSTMITNNTAKGDGGGLDLVATNTPITFTMDSTTVSGNTSQATAVSSSVGGGLSLGGNATLTNVTVTNNHSDQSVTANSLGGGIHMSGGTVSMNSTCSITNNTSNGNAGGTPGKGGGVSLNGGTLNLTGVTVSGNSAAGDGGAFFIDGTGPAPSSNAKLNMTNGSITGNSAANGGALATDSISTAATVLTGVSITNNTATTDTGGILQKGAAGNTITIDGITFTGNTSPSVKTTSGTISTANSVNTDNSVTIAGGILSAGSSTVDIGGSLTLSSGTFTGGSSSVLIAGNLTFSGGTFTAGTGSFTFDGGAAQAINGPSSPTFNNLTVNKLTGTLALTTNISESGNLTLTNGIFDLSTFTANRTAPGGTLSLANGTTLKIGTGAGTNTLPANFNTHSIGATSTIEYAGANQSVATLNSSQKYGHLVTSGSATKTLASAISIVTSLTIGAGTTLDVSASNFGITFTGANWTNNGTFNARNGTVTFEDTSGTQLLSGNTAFYNLALSNSGATTDLGSGTTTIANNLDKTAGSMTGGTGTIIFTGATGSITGAGSKQFNNLTVNSGAVISHADGNIILQKDYTNNGTFNQSPGLQTAFNNNNALHNLSGSGATTFGEISIFGSTTVDAGSHNFNTIGDTFDVTGTFTGNSNTVTFNGAVAQAILGNGTKNFNGMTVNNGNGVTVNNAAPTIDASVGGTLTLTTDLTVAAGAILQQSGMSSGAADVLGTVRRTDLGVTARAFGNLNNTITINSGTAPNPMDVTLAKVTPAGFPAGIAVVPRTYTLTPTGGSGISATVKLRYIDPGELAGIIEARLILWKNITGTWTAQGGTVDTVNNAVSLNGVSGFSDWAIAEGSDLTISKGNNVSNSAVVGQTWTWTLTVNNNGGALAGFTSGQTILTDNLPNSADISYGTPTPSDANINCSIDGSKNLTCTAGASGATIPAAGSFTIQFTAVAAAAATYANPRAGGIAQIDPASHIGESNEGNNDAVSNSVVVSKADTGTAVVSSQNPATAGDNVDFTATITVTLPGIGIPTGTVQFKEDGNNLGAPATVTGSGPTTAQLSTRCLTVGSHTMTGVYSGDTNFNTSTGTMVGMQSVVKPNSVTVDDNFVGSTDCQDLGGGNIFGRTAFATIAAGQAGVATGGTVNVAAGTYAEDVTLNGGTMQLTGNVNIQGLTLTSGNFISTSGTLSLTGNFTHNGGTFNTNTGTVAMTGSAAQTLGGSQQTAFSGLTISNGSGVTLGVSKSVAGTLTLTNGALSIGANTLTISGPISTTAGTLTGGATSNITIGGAGGTTTLPGVLNGLNTLTMNRASGVSLGGNVTVLNSLLLIFGDINTGAFTIDMPGTATSGPATNATDVVGNVRRSGFVMATPLSFGNPFNTIAINSGALPTDVNVHLAKSAPAGFSGAVQRTYNITPNGAHGPATLRLHYLDSELNSNTPESSLNLRRFNGTAWAPFVPTNSSTADLLNNWLEHNNVTTFSPWTFSTVSPTAAGGIVHGIITDSNGKPVEGAVVRLNGEQTRKTITDAKGRYHFDNVAANGFYTVTPSRVNYNFNPFNRAFNQSGNETEAGFGGIFTGDNANPLDTAEYFVRQQYVDLLGREPDEGGFNYWSDEILRCGGEAACVSARRSDIAAAFFIEQEFQRSGAFIYNLYKASLGRRPGYGEYAADRRQVVGGPTLEADKVAFAESFVQRPEFVQKYQANTTSESFVDGLLEQIWESSKVDLAGDRSLLLAIYQSDSDMTQSRSLVLQHVIATPAFKQAEYNPAFVLTEYFAYLKRNPEPEGYDFWLNVLNNSEPRNFRGMVCSFITSTEYQKRFSSVVTHSNAECGD